MIKLKSLIERRYSKAEMIRMGADGYLSSGVLKNIPIAKIDGSSPFVQTLGSYNVLITLQVSNLVDTVSTTGNEITPSEIADAVWNKIIPETPVTSSFGEWVAGRLLTVAHYLGMK